MTNVFFLRSDAVTTSLWREYVADKGDTRFICFLRKAKRRDASKGIPIMLSDQNPKPKTFRHWNYATCLLVRVFWKRYRGRVRDAKSMEFRTVLWLKFAWIDPSKMAFSSNTRELVGYHEDVHVTRVSFVTRTVCVYISTHFRSTRTVRVIHFIILRRYTFV